MFRDTRRKKLKDRVILVSLGLLVMAFGLWLNMREPADDGSVKAVDSKVEAESNSRKDDSDIETAASSKASDDRSTETGTEKQYGSYLVKEINGVVKVFLCDDSGSKELFMITSIPYELLSETDQKMFSEGVYIETKDDLGEFLENFDI